VDEIVANERHGHLGENHQAEPDAEEIQVALVRLYRLSGAHAAAAEQYGHYAQSLRDLGIDPPALSEV